MDIRKLQRAIVDGLEEVKAQHIVVLNTEHLSALFERVIIASGTSNRQTKALAASVRDAIKSEGLPIPRIEGETNGEWIIVDCGAAVVHVMQPVIREYYRLEEIWGGKPVNIKLNNQTTGLVKASASEKAPAKKAPPKKAAAAKVASVKVTAKKVVAKEAAPAAKKTVAAAKRPAQKVAPLRAGVTRVVGVRKEPAKKKAASSGSTTRTSTARKVASKKAPVKKTVPRA
jgi:ribosome-associated protein